ncbi:hypothetical protein MTX26_03495 [Bradyrhizobium sp. ISRA443]|uniref:hypothetical protein n=1 Tax=unclassified Bradyrhizobium TaxID=2631580 RepID=UPI00247A15D8|nr:MULTISPECIES: hypothetical protein [unclassified Bradyrhizobium]WGR95053.1 hypothetical protein MTX20_13600 [Bradyrhizobium sp. ISRA435]WGR99940.1 hypothetical protein MTX23_03495 [Bradyrhizobium sp. ISRA436]WGS06831.1 hypothetical protein MTX18_03495 [Bradyrhizobium sp. ISRA437]WGS13713.1 hypothetical protein MTX26_03495 [Bradyrhizobium sp. ISRA443]
MAQRHVATMNNPWCAGAIGIVLLALALAAYATIAHADNARGGPRQPDANVQRTAQIPPPARVILPAPWEPAAPARSAAAPAGSTDHK